MVRKVIDSKSKGVFPDFKEMYIYRDLFLTLSWRDFRVRYAQTTIGFFWAILQPIITLLILSLVFGKFVGVKTTVPHILFTVAGMGVWSYFSYVMSNSGNSIISSQEMVKKIYFPRLIIPLSKSLTGLIDLAINLFIIAVLMVYYKIYPSNNFWLAPVFILISMLASLGIGIWLSALTIRYRDFQYVVPFMVQIGLYITPIAYPAEFAVKKLPSWASTIYYLNPLAGVVQGFRWCLFGGEAPGDLMWLSIVMVLLLFISGLIYFNSIEAKIADYI